MSSLGVDPVDELPERRAHLHRITEQLNREQREFDARDPSREADVGRTTIRLRGLYGMLGFGEQAKVR